MRVPKLPTMSPRRRRSIHEKSGKSLLFHEEGHSLELADDVLGFAGVEVAEERDIRRPSPAEKAPPVEGVGQVGLHVVERLEPLLRESVEQDFFFLAAGDLSRNPGHALPPTGSCGSCGRSEE